MHVDASAIAALLLGEQDREELTRRLEQAKDRTTSPVSVLEAIMAVARETGDRAAGLPAVLNLLATAEITVSDVEADLVEGLADAFVRYGKGSKSRARLNLGDCFSYAMAKKARVPLLYKGGDFAETDLG